jgi:WD40 repeat protein
MNNPQLYGGANGKDGGPKPVLSIAMHPSGYYMAAGFVDRVRIMHVLDEELRDFRSLEHRNCHKMHFSNGGQFLVIVEQKMFFVYATYTLEKLYYSKCPSPNVSSIAFNDKDTYFSLVSADGFVYRYDLLNGKLSDGNIDRNSEFRSCLFLQNPDPKDQKEYLKLMIVGAENSKAVIRVYDENEDYKNIYKDDALTGKSCYTEVCIVKNQP